LVAIGFDGGPTASGEFDEDIDGHSEELRKEGRRIFRTDTFGSEAFWGGRLRLHEAIAGVRFGGVGQGLSPAAELALGLKMRKFRRTSPRRCAPVG